MKAKASFPSPTNVELKIIAEDPQDDDRLQRACDGLQHATGCISRAILGAIGDMTVSLTLVLHPLGQQGRDFAVSMEIETGDRYRIANFVEFFPSFVLYDAVASRERSLCAHTPIRPLGIRNPLVPFFCNWLENLESRTNKFSLAVTIRRVRQPAERLLALQPEGRRYLTG